jgi:aryl-alcohol dehydrogenase-like predicted oxidoreductase
VYLPTSIIAHHDPAQQNPQGPATRHPLLIGKELVQGKPALFVCRNFACQAPVTDPAAVHTVLKNQQQGQEAPGLTGASALEGTRLSGHATPGGTAAYAVRFVNSPTAPITAAYGFTSLGSTGLTTSRIGFGGYRIDTEEPEHRDALIKALREGCNLIDTSTNYSDGDSERLVGTVLADLIRRGELKREEAIVVSKIGYVQGSNLKRAEAREKAGKPFPEMVKYGEGIWHCLHPEFLADQLALSLDRLGLETLDVCLLHNPEYFLSDATHRADLKLDREGLVRAREEFYRRLQAAFSYFETQVAAGRLLYYGVSSNTCTAEANDPEATSLSRMLAAARTAAQQAGARSYHFNVLQCPMNLYESGGFLMSNTGPDATQTLLDLAHEENMAVLVNRPLNAMPEKRGSMVRLADLPVEPAAASYESQRAKVAALEDEYRREIAPRIKDPGQGLAPADYFRWAEELDRARTKVQNLEHWEQIETQMVAPHINQALRALNQHFSGEESDRWPRWRERYLPELLMLLREMRREATAKSREIAAVIARMIDPFLPESRRCASLSQKALWVLASTPGVSCVLNGMRTPVYVKDSIEVLRWEPLPDVRRVYEALKQPGSS